MPPVNVGALPSDEDIPYEEEILRNPYSPKGWLRYLEHKKTAQRKDRNLIFERALRELPGSYKLWKMYLEERLLEIQELPINDRQVDAVNGVFERCVVFLHKMPRIWLMWGEFLMYQKKITRTRQTFDRALQALPLTQHDRIWKLYLKFIRTVTVPETAIRVYRRYLKFAPDHVEEYIDYLRDAGYMDEAAVQLSKVVNDEKFQSASGKSQMMMWMELCNLISKHPDKIKSLNVEPILRSAFKTFTDEVGHLWCSLADYFIRRGMFEKARDTYEEGMGTVNTVRDFSQIYDAYAQFLEMTVNSAIAPGGVAASTTDDDFADIETELHFARYEGLIDRRALLLNSVLLRQNPHNVPEWQKRAKLYQDKGEAAMVVQTYTEGLRTVDPFKATGKIQFLWINFAKFYEANEDLPGARQIFERGTQAKLKTVDGLASIWSEYVEMELRHKQFKRALNVVQRATQNPGKKNIDYYDESKTPQERVFKSTKLWALYVDLQESLGTLEETREVYEKILELHVATPQMIINYAHMMEENNYFEESFKVYEKGIALFKFPHVFEIWKVYLTKFIERYQGEKIERARDLFEQALDKCPPKESKALYLLYAQLEERFGLARRAMGVYERAVKGVDPQDRLNMYEIYLARAAQFFGVTFTRNIFQGAIESLDDQGARSMCLRYAETERKLGEIDRARAIYAHCSQFCNPARDTKFWLLWQEFEKQHGNEDTYRQMLHIRRSVQATFATASAFMMSEMLEPTDEEKEMAARAIQPGETAMDALSRQAQEEAKKVHVEPAEKGVKFIKSGTVNADPTAEGAGAGANPEEIDIQEGEAEEGAEKDEAVEKLALGRVAVPAAVFGSLAAKAAPAGAPTSAAAAPAMGAMERMKKRKVSDV